MAKIVLFVGDRVVREVPLSKERLTIGRGRHNDLVIDDPAVSSEHAVIVSTGGDPFLEDMNSTNGTQVNGQPVKLHFLRDNDLVELANYSFRYVESNCGISSTGQWDGGFQGQASTGRAIAKLRVLNGAKAGKERILSKSITTIGRPDDHVAAILKLADGYYVTLVEGSLPPVLNGELLSADPQEIRSGDVIELSGTQVLFLVE